jgi:hypothetical protein
MTPPRALTCDCCRRTAHFRFDRVGAAPTLRCWLHAVFYPPLFHQALLVAAVVGTILFVINQLNVVVSGQFTLLVGLKIGLTYVVPYLVATYSALAINRLSPARSGRTGQEGSDSHRATT